VQQFGPVQQVQIDEGNKDGVVYVKFESVMSALNVRFTTQLFSFTSA